MDKLTYIIRPMREGDILQITEIDREAFPSEWMFRSLSSYQRELNNPLAHYLVASIPKGMLIQLSQPIPPQLPFFRGLFCRDYPLTGEGSSSVYILGFTSFWLMSDEAHITSIATRSEYRRIGIGEALLISMIGLATRLNANMVTLEVRASNKVAQTLYKKYGFQMVGNRPNYYSDNGEDALLMNTDNVNSASFQENFQQLKKAHRQRWGEMFVATY